MSVSPVGGAVATQFIRKTLQFCMYGHILCHIFNYVIIFYILYGKIDLV